MRRAGLLAGGLVLWAIGAGLIVSHVSVWAGFLLFILSAVPLGLSARHTFRRA